VAGRLLVRACPADVVARRLARLRSKASRQGRPPSAGQREMCRWWVLWTNVPADRLTPEQAREVYRLRWQVELLIKRLKSEGGLGQSSSRQAGRVEAEWYLKLLGQVVRHWLQLLSGGPLRRVNSQELGRIIVDELGAVLQGLRGGVRVLFGVLWQLREQLQRVRPRTARQHNKTAAQRLQEEEARQRTKEGGPDTPKKAAGRENSLT
jgi:hypothetical protein